MLNMNVIKLHNNETNLKNKGPNEIFLFSLDVGTGQKQREKEGDRFGGVCDSKRFAFQHHEFK